ncbi:MAG: efflux RND transporter periplasmic adaptor subunit [Anaerolineales bacterium]|nr:efflux RND transporter periplasmic adaptor subunit [Anaerolineales bacterium]
MEFIVDKRAVIVFVIVGILIVSAAGYFGFSTTQEPEPTPTPQTVTVNRCDVGQTVTAPGNLVNVGLENVNMPTTGKLSEVYIRAGDVVKEGQVLAELDEVTKSEAQLKLVEAREKLEKEQKERTSLDYPRASEDYIKQQKNKVKLLKQKISFQVDAYNEAEDAAAKEMLLNQLTATQTELQEEEAELKWIMSKPSDADFDEADSELSLAQANYDAVKALLDSLSIVAPYDGVVLEAKAQTGISISADTTLFKVGDPKALEVKANITEEDFPIVAVGQEVELFFDARSDLSVQGFVDRIIPIRIEGDTPRYQIFIVLHEVPDGLADGMTADASITITKRENVLCLPRSVVRASGVDEVVLKVWVDQAIETRIVTIGLRGDSDVEIISGLSEGDQVVIQ